MFMGKICSNGKYVYAFLMLGVCIYCICGVQYRKIVGASAYIFMFDSIIKSAHSLPLLMNGIRFSAFSNLFCLLHEIDGKIA